MSRAIISVMALAIITAVSARSEAATGKWCFQWKTDSLYEDNDKGEDAPFGATYPAKYTYVTVHQTNPWNDFIAAYFLDANGCTPVVSITPWATYHFQQFTRAKRGDRNVYVLATNEDWESTDTFFHEWDYLTLGTIPSSKTFGPPALMNDETRKMPVICRMLNYANTLRWLDDDTLKVRSDCDNSWHDRINGDLSYICYKPGADHEFGIAHEIGHMIANMDDGPRPSNYAGSEGRFRHPVDGYGPREGGDGSHNCDEDLMMDKLGTKSHDMTSREFTGSAQGEAFANFIASATFNDSEDGDGVFVYGKGMMKWSNTHDGQLPWPIILPPSHPSYLLPYWAHPTVISLSDGSTATDFVRWTEEECDPSEGDLEYYEKHFGVEWDWLEFYWNLWTDAANPYTVGDIDEIWSDTTQAAVLCCDAEWDDDNDAWVPVDMCIDKKPGLGDCGGPIYGAFPVAFTVGQLWQAYQHPVHGWEFGITTGLRNAAHAKYNDPIGHPGTYNPDKYNLFFDTGDDTGVNY